MPPEVLGYHHLSLSVRELPRSTAWYQKVLGLEITAQIEGEGFQRTRMKGSGGALTLTLTQHDATSHEPFDERCIGMDHVSFAVKAGSVAMLKTRFEELGVEHSDLKDYPGGVSTITFRDPDNIQLEVFG